MEKGSHRCHCYVPSNTPPPFHVPPDESRSNMFFRRFVPFAASSTPLPNLRWMKDLLSRQSFSGAIVLDCGVRGGRDEVDVEQASPRSSHQQGRSRRRSLGAPSPSTIPFTCIRVLIVLVTQRHPRHPSFHRRLRPSQTTGKAQILTSNRLVESKVVSYMSSAPICCRPKATCLRWERTGGAQHNAPPPGRWWLPYSS